MPLNFSELPDRIQRDLGHILVKDRVSLAPSLDKITQELEGNRLRAATLSTLRFLSNSWRTDVLTINHGLLERNYSKMLSAYGNILRTEVCLGAYFLMSLLRS